MRSRKRLDVLRKPSGLYIDTGETPTGGRGPLQPLPEKCPQVTYRFRTNSIAAASYYYIGK